MAISFQRILGGGHLLLMTDAGPLDLLGFIGQRQCYEDLKDRFEEISIEGCTFAILGLEELIRQKQHLGRYKDLPALRMLEAVMRQRRSTG